MQFLICSQGEGIPDGAVSLLEERGIGIELQGYGLKGVRSLEAWRERLETHRRFRDRFQGLTVMHGPFIGVNYCHDDHYFRRAVRRRLDRTFEAVRTLRAHRLVLHSGLSTDVGKFGITDDWIRLTADFWRDEIRRYEEIGVTVVLENIVDDSPDFLRIVHDRVDHPNLKICLDTGHVNVWSSRDLDDWLTGLGSRIHHIHLHNNDGTADQHRRPDDGTLDITAFLQRVRKEIPHAWISLEAMAGIEEQIEILEHLICA
ncbi:MAG TPA: sugar phosphate isomerase/epimerase [bacterium]|nr:sugar phosphate isomerase/epimerase [bacterium]